MNTTVKGSTNTAPATAPVVDPAAQAAALAAEQKAAVAKTKADAKAAADAAKAEAKAVADKAKAEAKAAAEKAKADTKAATDAAKAAAAEQKAAAAKAAAEQKAAAAAAKPVKIVQPSKNGVTRPKPDGACGKVWQLADEISARIGQPVPIAMLSKETAAAGLNDATTRTQYARWKLYNGVFGAVAKPAEPAPAAQAAA